MASAHLSNLTSLGSLSRGYRLVATTGKCVSAGQQSFFLKFKLIFTLKLRDFILKETNRYPAFDISVELETVGPHSCIQQLVGTEKGLPLLDGAVSSGHFSPLHSQLLPVSQPEDQLLCLQPCFSYNRETGF